MTLRVSSPDVEIRQRLNESDKNVGPAGKKVMQAVSKYEAFESVHAGRKNIIHNGNFEIAQRKQFSSSYDLVNAAGVNTYTFDRWKNRPYGNNRHRITRGYSLLPNGTKAYSMKVEDIGDSNGADAGGGNFWHMIQPIYVESWMKGKTFKVSYWYKANALYYPRYCDSLGCYVVGQDMITDGQWHKMEWDFPVPEDAVVNTTMQLHPAFTKVDGSKIKTGEYIEFAQVQMELEHATPFEELSYQENLRTCQRYYYEFNQNGGSIGHGSYQSSTYYRCFVKFPVPMHRIPDLNIASGTNYYRTLSRDNSTDLMNSLSLSGNTSRDAALLNNTTEASGTAGSGGDLQLNSSAAYIGFNADL